MRGLFPTSWFHLTIAKFPSKILKKTSIQSLNRVYILSFSKLLVRWKNSNFLYLIIIYARQSYYPMEPPTKANGLMEREMVKENNNGLMVLYMKGFGRKINHVAK